VQGLNHDPDARRRESRLKQWVGAEFAGRQDLCWWEFTAAASSTLGIHALFAHAADPDSAPRAFGEVDRAYMPWVCAASTMLDSYVDKLADLAGEGHCYVAHYADPSVAAQRVCDLIGRSMREARQLRRGLRHALIVAGMAAMYLSADEARTPAMRETTERFVEAGGSLTRALLPILRLWRLVNGRRSA
jgi:tetraprenyl-beta-curcumene synthase